MHVDEYCPTCNGKGTVPQPVYDADSNNRYFDGSITVDCPDCNPKGEEDETPTE